MDRHRTDDLACIHVQRGLAKGSNSIARRHDALLTAEDETKTRRSETK